MKVKEEITQNKGKNHQMKPESVNEGCCKSVEPG